MPSPFPGMNPYLEKPDVWSDFHQRFLPEMAKEISRQVGDEYVVRLDSHVYLHELSAQERGFLGRADVSLAEGQPSSGGNSTLAIREAPIFFSVPACDEVRVPFMEIRDRENRFVVTVIELLSPANKYSGPDRSAYLNKRQPLFRHQTNFVEIDLLRGGPDMPNPGVPPCDYSVVVRRASDWTRIGFWPIQLREPLPTIPIPLRDPSPDAIIDLQGLLNSVYESARYQNSIYVTPPVPALNKEDEAWANECLRAAGLR